MHEYIHRSAVTLDFSIVCLQSHLQCVASGEATRHHSHDCCHREELECNTKEGGIWQPADFFTLQQLHRFKGHWKSSPLSQVCPNVNYHKKTLLCFVSRPRTTSLAASCWNLLWQSVPTCWPLASRCRRSVKGAAALFQLTTPPSPAFTYSQLGIGCAGPTLRHIIQVLSFWLIFVFCKCSSSENTPQWFNELSNGLLLTQKVMAGFLALHMGRKTFSVSVFLCHLEVRCCLSPALFFFLFFLQW